VIAVLDYGIGNLRSAQKALCHVGGDARLIDRPSGAKGASGVVLPGVGAFGACADALSKSGLDVTARQAIDDGVPFLGLCVGFQLLFEASEESPGVKGLGVFSGTIRKLSEEVKLPQMQWNVVQRAKGRSPAMFAGMPEAPWFYFVHSFAPMPRETEQDVIAATCDYGGPFVAAIERGSCWGTQFHPEKSGSFGLKLLSSFVEMSEERVGRSRTTRVEPKA
jgi:imidazole glycerol-phosphate synthase subunit HisH